MLEPEDILKQFCIEGVVKSISSFGNGHIHRTYKIENTDEHKPDYLLQQISHAVFPDVEALMKNIDLVTQFLRDKIQFLKPKVCNLTLTIIPTHEGKLFYKDKTGKYWRVYVFMNDLRSYDIASSPSQISQSGQAFGTFINLLDEFDSRQLTPVIPNFHSVEFRLGNFENAIAKDSHSRKGEVEMEIKELLQLREPLSSIEILGLAGEIPLRVTHNDTKFNNVLLDRTDTARCVIDLDTVMAGHIHYDFGDAIRTTANMVPEDESDLNKVDVDLQKFEAFTEGFLQATKNSITPKEVDYLPISAALLSYLMAVRFMTDYLEGDIYYQIKYPKHNLVRSKNQLMLTQKMMDNIPHFKSIIHKCLRR